TAACIATFRWTRFRHTRCRRTIAAAKPFSERIALPEPALTRAARRSRSKISMETSVSSKTMNKLTDNSRRNFLATTIFSTAWFGAMLFSPPAVRAQNQNSNSNTDRVVVTLSDPSRPSTVQASLIAGGITVKTHEGKDVIVEARARTRDSGDSDGNPKRINISSTGLSVEEENNQVRISTESHMRAIELTITVPVHTSLYLRAVNEGDIHVTGVDGELDV